MISATKTPRATRRGSEGRASGYKSAAVCTSAWSRVSALPGSDLRNPTECRPRDGQLGKRAFRLRL